jgi:hypothetical protein
MPKVADSQPASLSQRAHQWGTDTKAPSNELNVEVVTDRPGGGSGSVAGSINVVDRHQEPNS